MPITDILPLLESLSHADKFQLIQSLLAQLAREKGYLLQVQAESNMDCGKRIAEILQRMADRQALPHISDPMAWQRETREDRQLFGRD